MVSRVWVLPWIPSLRSISALASLPCCALYATPQSPTTKAAAAAAGLADFVSGTVTRVQQDDVDARRAKEKASAAAMERQQAYDAALARVDKAKEEARAAANARDATLAHADRERAVTKAAATALAPLLHEGDSSAPAPTDIHGAMLLQEVAALHLHAQIVAFSNIRSLIHIALDIDSDHYNRWRAQFLLTLSKFSLQDHVHLNAPVPSLDSDRMDYVINF
jgi:hypothetical protein